MTNRILLGITDWDKKTKFVAGDAKTHAQMGALPRSFVGSTRVSAHRLNVGEPEMIVHLVDGTYELFRHFYGLRRFTKGKDRPYGAVVGVLQTILQMMRERRHVSSASPPIT